MRRSTIPWSKQRFPDLPPNRGLPRPPLPDSQALFLLTLPVRLVLDFWTPCQLLSSQDLPFPSISSSTSLHSLPMPAVGTWSGPNLLAFLKHLLLCLPPLIFPLLPIHYIWPSPEPTITLPLSPPPLDAADLHAVHPRAGHHDLL